MYDYIIIGAGIVGLSVGMALTESFNNKRILVLEKENELASHQTGHNSGVIHSGIYYQPGSYKAEFAKRGRVLMTQFCEKHEIEYDVCGKVIVAVNNDERKSLEILSQRGFRNGLKLEKLNKDKLLEIEPHVNGVEAIKVASTGIVDYKKVALKFSEIIKQYDSEIKCGEEVKNIEEYKSSVTVETETDTYVTKFLINCAGLQSDRIAKMAGYHTDIKIIPFRGEYYELIPEKRHLVKNLIYPVPNSQFPFLGVHFTRMINNSVEVGPNAVLSFKREGYKKSDINLKDTAETLGYKGFRHLARKYMKVGLVEIGNSISKKKFTKGLQYLIPEITEKDLISAPAGVRAQALTSEGKLVDDFQMISGKRSLHVCNAPSPAATASIEIGRQIVEHLSKKF